MTSAQNHTKNSFLICVNMKSNNVTPNGLRYCINQHKTFPFFCRKIFKPQFTMALRSYWSLKLFGMPKEVDVL